MIVADHPQHKAMAMHSKHIRAAARGFTLIASPRASRGFTLIEILVVVVILGILAAIVVPRVMEHPGEARQVRAKQDIQAVVTALNTYKLDNFTYPSTEQGLDALVRKPAGTPEAPNWHQYLDKLPKDLEGSLPTIEQIEAELAGNIPSKRKPRAPQRKRR